MVPQNFFVWNTSCNISNNINHNKLKNSNNKIILVYIAQEIHNCDAVSLLIFYYLFRSRVGPVINVTKDLTG